MVVAASLEDRVEIHELLGRYGTAIDRRDWAALDGVFTRSGTFDLTDIGCGVLSGLDAIKAFMTGPARHPHAHLITNVVVDFTTADDAVVRSRILAVQHDGSVETGTYDDRFVRTEDGWRLQARVFAWERRQEADTDGRS